MKKKAAAPIEAPAEFVHDFFFLRSADMNGQSRGKFQWPIVAGSIVEAPDWNAAPVCGGGLHGLAEGIGEWGLLKAPSDPLALWYVCGAIRSEAVVLDDSKIKVPRCRVLYVGSFAGAMDLISPRMTAEVMRLAADRKAAAGYSGAASNSGYSGAASNSGDSGAASNSGYSGAASNSGDRGAASNSGYRGAASNSGDRGAASNSGDSGAASSIGRHGVALSHGLKSRGMVTESNLLVLVERDPKSGRIIHHFSALAGERGVAPGVWYTLVDGQLTKVRA